MNACGQVSLWLGDSKGKGFSWKVCLRLQGLLQLTWCSSGMVPKHPAWEAWSPIKCPRKPGLPRLWQESGVQWDKSFLVVVTSLHAPSGHGAIVGGLDKFQPEPWVTSLRFYFSTVTTRGCPSGAGALVRVPGWLRSPERTIAPGLPPTGAREAKPRASAKPGSALPTEGLVGAELPLPSPELDMHVRGPQAESRGPRSSHTCVLEI